MQTLSHENELQEDEEATFEEKAGEAPFVQAPIRVRASNQDQNINPEDFEIEMKQRLVTQQAGFEQLDIAYDPFTFREVVPNSD